MKSCSTTTQRRILMVLAHLKPFQLENAAIKKNSWTTSICTNGNGRPLNGSPWASQVTSDGDLSRVRLAGSGSAPCPSISCSLAVTERDSAEKLWALHCRGLTTDWTGRPSTATLVPSWFLTTEQYKWLAEVEHFQQRTSGDFWQMHLERLQIWLWKSKPLGFCFDCILTVCTTYFTHVGRCLVTRRTTKALGRLTCCCKAADNFNLGNTRQEK